MSLADSGLWQHTHTAVTFDVITAMKIHISLLVRDAMLFAM